MNTYECHLNTGDHELDAVTPIIVAPTRGRAKAILLAAADDAGFEVDWTTKVSIHIRDRQVNEPEGICRY